MEQTPNYKLLKPAPNDYVDIGTFNQNTDIIDSELKKKYGPDNKPTAADVDAAPAGYGLGGSAKSITITSIDELDTITANGWYTIWFPSGTIINNIPMVVALMFCHSYGSSMRVQRLYPRYRSYELIRFTTGANVWGAFECINPPMELGVEYRTTELCEDKPVYAKRISYTTDRFAANSALSIPHGISNYSSLVRVAGLVGIAYPLPYFAQPNTVTGIRQVDYANVVIETNAAWGTFSVKIDIYYTKTTN